uniref:Uncharacterized protein n=1 Tax=uncultured prokaryote TaxID=198431 RepID=A0A0H5Q2A5_9ZZZZ|nr:hypothetical protein [uncultured prokaryote]
MCNESNIQNKKSFVACFNLIKLIASGYALIALLIGCITYTWYHEWQEVEALEVGNQRIDEFRKEVNRIHIRLIEFSLLGETVLDWDETDLAMGVYALDNGRITRSDDNDGDAACETCTRTIVYTSARY